MTTLSDHFRGYRGTGEHGRTDLDRFALADHEYLVESDFSAYISRYLFYFEFFAGSNAILLATGFYDRIHDERLQWDDAKNRAVYRVTGCRSNS
jgi:hypothetical protein